MDSKHSETTGLFSTKYVSYNGDAGTPVTPAESADGCFKEDEERGDDGGAGTGRTHKGLSMGLGAMFLLAEMAGAGLLSIPRAVANTGWAGLPLMVVLGAAVGFAGTRLALCWVLLEHRWPEYRAPCRRPYPAIALRALGVPGQVITEVCLVITLFGAAVVYILLASQMASDIFSSILPSLSQCAWALILGAALCPTVWFSSPKDFWGAPVFALTSMVLACLVVVVEVVLEKGDHDPPTFPSPTFTSIFLAFGAMLFAFGGASLFPTIQNDMKDRSQFPHSVVVTFMVLLAIYLPVSTICYGLLGDNGVTDNILQAVSGPAVKVTNIFTLCHFLFAFSIVINPITQTFEGLLGMPNAFGVRRVLLRTGIVMLVMLVGFGIPDFGKILNLIGGSTVTIMSFVMPPLCYLRLCAFKGLDGLPYKVVPWWEVAVLWAILCLGVVGGVSSTWSAISDIFSGVSFANTCFSSSKFNT